MKICSWDVGIKDLAYCILNNDNGKITVEKWGILNMMENVNPTCQFTEERKNKQKLIEKHNCDNPAKFTAFNKDGSIVHLCGVHKKRHVIEIEDSVAKDKVDKVNLCCYTNKIPCNKPTKFLRNNQHFCSLHEKSEYKKELKQLTLKPLKKITTKTMDIQDMCEIFIRKLDSNPFLLEVDTVLVENQPSFKNPQMKTFSIFLYSYFVTRGLIDKKTVKQVKFMSPSNKLKVHPERTKTALEAKTIELKKTEIEKEKTKIAKEIYDITKSLSVEYTKEYLKGDATMLAVLDKCPAGQKDDLCDSFLQAVYFINQNLSKDPS